MQYLDAISKMTEWSLFISKANHSIAQHSKSMPRPVMLKKLKLKVVWRPTKPSRTNTQKICAFRYSKGRKWRDTWSNRQIWPWRTKWSKAKTSRILPKEFTGHSKQPLPTIQEKTIHMDITRLSLPKSDWLYSLQSKMEKLYTVSKNKTGADCGSDHECPISSMTLCNWEISNMDQLQTTLVTQVKGEISNMRLKTLQ